MSGLFIGCPRVIVGPKSINLLSLHFNVSFWYFTITWYLRSDLVTETCYATEVAKTQFSYRDHLMIYCILFFYMLCTWLSNSQKQMKAERYSMMFFIHVAWCYHTPSLSKIAHSFSLPVFIMWEKPVFCFNETCCSPEQNVECLRLCVHVFVCVRESVWERERAMWMNPESRWKNIPVGGNKHKHTCVQCTEGCMIRHLSSNLRVRES